MQSVTGLPTPPQCWLRMRKGVRVLLLARYMLRHTMPQLSDPDCRQHVSPSERGQKGMSLTHLSSSITILKRRQRNTFEVIYLQLFKSNDEVRCPLIATDTGMRLC